jgi:hypothetical protein
MDVDARLRRAIRIMVMQKIGMVAPNAHQTGNVKSAISPRTLKVIQKISRCISLGSTDPAVLKLPLGELKFAPAR